MADKNLYNAESIESLDPLAFTRLKPGVYCGDTSYSTQLLVEIFSNAVDEHRLGHGNTIEIGIVDDIVQVRDYGQGFLVNEKREDGKTVLEAAFSVLNTSGKYREDGVYEGTSLGNFGIGSKLPVFLSHWCKVTTIRDYKSEELYFKEGVLEKRDTGVCLTRRTGTIVQWKPSEEFFGDTHVDMKAIRSLCTQTACLNPGLEIIITENGVEEHIYSERGLADLVDTAVNDKEIIKNRFEMHYVEGKEKMDMILTYTSSYSMTMIPYVNVGLTEKGPHITQIKTVITREMNKFFRDKKWIKEKEENLSGDDIQEGMYVVFNLTAPNVAYDAQVKSNIVKIDMKNFSVALANELQKWFAINEKEIKTIADKALSARKARQAAKKAREAVRKPKEKGLKAKMQLSEKFIDCKSKNPNERNLIVVEGLSAGSSAIEARNPNTDAIYMLRGKILSILKTDFDKVMKNQVLSDVIQVIGAGVGSSFEVDKMAFNKVVITTDADSDGGNIELLLITFFYTYMRDLVIKGKLYKAVTPLYIVYRKNKEPLYFYTDKEYNDWLSLKEKADSVLRAKGLGELDATQLHEVCFKNQKFKKITVSDAIAAEQLLDVLMGKKTEPRKQYIYDNAERLGFNFM